MRVTQAYYLVELKCIHNYAVRSTYLEYGGWILEGILTELFIGSLYFRTQTIEWNTQISANIIQFNWKECSVWYSDFLNGILKIKCYIIV